MKSQVNEIKKLQSIAGILKEYELGDEDPRDLEDLEYEELYELFLNELKEAIESNIETIAKKYYLNVESLSYNDVIDDLANG